jgi:hypothetical protein
MQKGMYASRIRELKNLSKELAEPIKDIYEKTGNGINYVKVNLEQRWNSMDDVRKRLVRTGVAYSAIGAMGHILSIYLFGIPGFPPVNLDSVRAMGQFGGTLLSFGYDFAGVVHMLTGIKTKNQDLPPMAELPSPQTWLDDYL